MANMCDPVGPDSKTYDSVVSFIYHTVFGILNGSFLNKSISFEFPLTRLIWGETDWQKSFPYLSNSLAPNVHKAMFRMVVRNLSISTIALRNARGTKYNSGIVMICISPYSIYQLCLIHNTVKQTTKQTVTQTSTIPANKETFGL